MSGTRVGIGRYWLDSQALNEVARALRPAPSRASEPAVEEPLVWRTASRGSLLARGRKMTQPEAIRYCTASPHVRNELVNEATTTNKITYRTCAGDRVVYLGGHW